MAFGYVEGRERVYKGTEEGEAKEKTEKEEVSKDVSAELQEVRERLAVEMR